MTSYSQQAPGKPRNWTVMVYMAADDSHKLDTVAVRDLKEMESGTQDNDNVAVVVQINRHWPKAAQRYEITSEGTKLLPSPTGDTNMGKETTLTAFLTDVVSNDEYRATNYCLVLWGHAFGIGFGRDHHDPLLLPELRTSLKKFKDLRSGTPLEILGTNACTMSYLEAAFELRGVASRMIASQITVPFSGWPYGVILDRIGTTVDVDEASRLIVDAYVSQFDDLPGGDRLAMTVLDLTRTGDLDDKLETLAAAIDREIRESGFAAETMATFRDVFMGAAAGDVRPLIDLSTLCKTLGGEGTDTMSPPVADAANSLLDALQPRDPRPGDDPKMPPAPTLVKHKQRHRTLYDLNGLGIYAPFITDEGILDRFGLLEPSNGAKKQSALEVEQGEYRKLSIFSRGKTSWPTLVYKGLKRTIPADLMVAIDGIGELQTGDRADVAQIIMSIEAALNQVDRAVARAKNDIVAQVVKGPVPDQILPGSMAAMEGVATLAPVRAKKAFGPPWLRLVQPLTAQALREVQELKDFQRDPADAPYLQVQGANGERPDVVNAAVDHFATVERAIGNVERVIRRALTHVRFGLGPFSPNKLLAGDMKPGLGNGDVKPGTGNGDVKPGTGNGDTKPGTGDVGALIRPGLSSGDLRADLALLRVADLFQQVGESLVTLEAAAAGVEATARAMLVVLPVSTPDPRDSQRATAQEIDQAFRDLEEASSETRRTVRRILAHPVYGLGPGEDPLSLDIREELALAGGLSRRHLKLL